MARLRAPGEAHVDSVSGSVAFDHIMVFPDRFKNHILPEKLHVLNVSFNITSLKTHFGGVAGNIAYHLRLLGDDPLILATVGHDFGPYADWLDRHRIRRHAIRVFDDIRTPQGFVTTDLDDSQIWAFYEGAIARAHRRASRTCASRSRSRSSPRTASRRWSSMRGRSRRAECRR